MLLQSWADALRANNASPATVTVRLAAMHALMVHAGVTDPLQITRLDVVGFLARPRAQWTKVTYWRSIRSWCRFCTDFDIVIPDLLRGIESPTSPDPAARPIGDETVRRLLEAPLTFRAKAYVRLALFCGLRVHEIAKIRAEDFDFEARWLRVTGKGAQTKSVPVHRKILELADQMPEMGYWFPSHSDAAGHVSARAVSETIGAALRSVGSMATAHQLRDTAATRVQRQHRDIRVTQAFLRHKNVTTTQKYTEVSNEDLRSAVDDLDWGDAA